MFVSAAEAGARGGGPTRIRTEIDAAGDRLETRRDELVDTAGQLADRLEGTIPAIYGADLTVPVARRWKCQINENAKLPAFWAELPEADHNELVGWTADAAAPLSAVFLADPDQHPRARRRLELADELAGRTAAAHMTIETAAESRTELMLGAEMLDAP